jgi:anthranilate phosphoribosyltransferase
MKDLLQQLLHGTPLTFEQAEAAFTDIMAGTADAVQTGSLLTLLAVREPTVEELHGAATVLRRHVVAIDAPDTVIDTCGTGGVGSSLFNISTTAAIVAAAAGAYVAKHGNRSVTSRSGSSDVLRELGVNIDTSPTQAAACLRDAHICFAYAPRHHPAMKNVGPIRQALGFSTLFNLLGPLTNPAGSRRQIVGARTPALADKILDVLIRLGAQRSLVLVGADPRLGALCDISITGPTQTFAFDAATGRRTASILMPEDLGLRRWESSADLEIRSVQESAARIRAILDGRPGAPRDIVVANAAAALWAAGLADTLPAGVPLAQAAIDSGAARTTLARLIDLSHQ